MGVGKERRGAEWVIRMEGELGVAEASALRENLIETLEDGTASSVVLEMGSVESLDVCCLQVLLAASRSPAAAGGRLAVGEMSEACREAVELAGQKAEEWLAR